MSIAEDIARREKLARWSSGKPARKKAKTEAVRRERVRVQKRDYNRRAREYEPPPSDVEICNGVLRLVRACAVSVAERRRVQGSRELAMAKLIAERATADVDEINVS